jgi:hypothetical protein
MTPEEIFANHPEFDYRRLEDEEFRASPEGVRLEEAYRRLCGYILSQQHDRYPRPITDDGRTLSRPLIPLVQFPIIEAVMIEEVSFDRLKAKYDFGPSDVTDFILQSDSEPAIEALVASINLRLPEGERRVFDGPTEFQHKHRMIRELIGAYRESAYDEPRRELMKRGLLSVFETYTDDGEIAQSVRQEHRAYMARGYEYAPRETHDVKEIISDILTVTLASPDAEAFIARYMPDFERGLATEADPLALDAPTIKPSFQANQ